MPSTDADGTGLTPLDREVIDSLATKLREVGVSEAAISGLTMSYQAARTPSADALLGVLKQASAAPEVSE